MACDTFIQRGRTATSAMKQTSLISLSRSVQGSRPSTFNSPSKGVRPRMAFSAVLLPAPLAPMRPRMRPSSILRSIPSTATVEPKLFLRPCASMTAISVLLLLGGGQQIFGPETETLDRFDHLGPLLLQEFLALSAEKQLLGAGIDEHSTASFRFDEVFVDQLLIPLEHGQGLTR